MKEKIKEVIKRVFCLDNVEDDISPLTYERWDSMNHLHLVIEIEEEFNVSLDPEDMMEMKSIEKIKEILEKKVTKGNL